MVRMARIVITSFGSYGDLFPYIGLALGLVGRGHRPVLAMPAIYRDLVEREGIAFHAVRPDLDPQDRALAARIMDAVNGTDVLFSELLIPSLAASFDDVSAAAQGADLLISHPATLVGPIVAEVRRLRWASSVLAPLSFFSRHDPIVPPPAPWVQVLTSRSLFLSGVFLRLTERLTQKWARPVQAFREQLGLPAGANPILAGQHSPHLVLALFSRVLGEPQPDWPARTALTGAVLYNGADADTLPHDIAAFLDAGEPPIVFTLGTSAIFSAGTFYEVSAAAARRLGRRAVLLVGPGAVQSPLTGDGVLAAAFAPHRALFARAAAIVHQGGVGTLHQALASGHPMIVVPHSHDQPDNAHRATRLGVARTIAPKQYRVDAVSAALHAILDDTRVRQRASEVAAIVRGEHGVDRACDAIERVLE
jgi:UDP:flavonoid glycosyltransferase YjiC (YdhE family)